MACRHEAVVEQERHARLEARDERRLLRRRRERDAPRARHVVVIRGEGELHHLDRVQSCESCSESVLGRASVWSDSILQHILTTQVPLRSADLTGGERHGLVILGELRTLFKWLKTLFEDLTY